MLYKFFFNLFIYLFIYIIIKLTINIIIIIIILFILTIILLLNYFNYNNNEKVVEPIRKIEMKLQIPEPLKLYLVDDWENITKDKKVILIKF